MQEEICNPLLAVLGFSQKAQAFGNIGIDLIVEELGKSQAQLFDVVVTKTLGFAGFDKFLEESRKLVRIERIAHLTDQISGAYQTGKGVDLLVVLIFRYWKPRHFDVAGDRGHVDQWIGSKSLMNEDAAASDVIRHHGGISSSDRRRYPGTGFIGDATGVAIFAQQPAHITDVMEQHCDDRVQPLVRADITVRHEPAAQNGLANVRHQHGVLIIMVGAVAMQQSFHGNSRSLLEQFLVARGTAWKGFAVARHAVLDKGVDNRPIRIEHGSSADFY